MRSNRNRAFLVFLATVVILCGLGAGDLMAQATNATILGTVTDTSGGAVPDARVTISNTGTGAVQVTQTDAQGRYEIPALPVGQYDVQSEKAGFQAVVHRGITLTVGANAVVDFSLTVGQVAQAITVEGNVAQVETTSSAISNVVQPTQMRELPLNGRDFEQLILLSPGVTIHQAIGYTAQNGTGNAYSVSGSRTRGQWELLDGNDIMNWQGRGAGAGVLGTQLGVDAMAEFQVLTNTYSAQYGGNGAAVIAVTRSGTNNFHGSAYEFIRNSALDSRNFFDPPQKPAFRKNQFGGTVGGPIKKDKMFFFVNYEGVRQNTGIDYPYILPDAAGLTGFVPATSGTALYNSVYNAQTDPNAYYCVNNNSILWSSGAGAAACYATIPAGVQKLLKYFPAQGAYPYTVNLGPNGLPNGLITAQETMYEPGGENYVTGRFDWTVSDKDSVFARYLRDSGHLTETSIVTSTASAADPNGVPSNDISTNQYLALGEKRIWSTNLITSTSFGFTRTLTGSASTLGLSDFQWEPGLWSSYSSICPAGAGGTINILPMINPNITVATLGANVCFRDIQNKYSVGEDVFWTRGAHSFQFGGSIQRVQSYTATPTSPGSWTFANMAAFLQDAPTTGSAVCDAALYATCSVLPTLNPVQHFLQSNYGLYIQDNWKVKSTVTINLGFRYSPSSNPATVGETRGYPNLPLSPSYNPNLPMPGCSGLAISTCAVAAGTLPSTLESNIYLKNPALHTFAPRIGVAWDPFKDHKTSVRAGYGIFTDPVLPYDFTSTVALPLQYLSASFACPAPCASFPFSTFSAGGAAAQALIAGGGIDPGDRSTPYVQQYNLFVQHEFSHNTMVSVGYVGSHSVHLLGEIDENPPLPAGVPGAITIPGGKCLVASQAEMTGLVGASGGSVCNPVGAAPLSVTSANGQAVIDSATGQRMYSFVECPVGYTASTTTCSVASNNLADPAIDISPMHRTTFWGKYNSLQAGVVQRLTNSLQAQVSYTWAACQSTNGGSGGFDNGLSASDPWQYNTDKGNCAFYIRHDLSANAIYYLPFKGNRLVSGWQVTSVYSYHTGEPLQMSTGWNSGIAVQHSGPFPNLVSVVAGCNQVQGQVNSWFNTSCFYQPPIGEDGNAMTYGAFGPDFSTWDASLVKNTTLTERFVLQFRAEFFNVINRANFRNPGQPMAFVFQENSPLPPSCATNPSTCSSTLGSLGQIIQTQPNDGNARQIQFGLKLTF